MILPGKRRSGRSCRNNSDWDPFFFFLLISFFPALILTIIFIFLNIKTIFWSEYGTLRSPGGYVGVSLFLWGYTAFVSIILYVLYYLLKTIREKPVQKKLATKYLLIFFGEQLLILSLFTALKKWGGWSTLPFIFLIIVLSGFFTHHFFSKSVVKLLRDQYPYRFPKFFDRGGMRPIGWPIMITLILVNLQVLSLLCYL